MNNDKNPSMVIGKGSDLGSQNHHEPWNRLIIDLDALTGNYRRLRSRIPSHAPLFVVLKSDAYGHGIAESGRALAATGCRHFAVETPQEGIQLRKHGIEHDILILNPIPLWMSELAVYHDFLVTVIHESILAPLEEAAGAMGKRCRVHLNVNVGLNRMGIAPSKLARTVKAAREKPSLIVEGLYAQPRDHHTAMAGFRKFLDLYEELHRKGLAPEMIHFANSTTFLSHPEIAKFGARLGILVYGALPPEHAGDSGALIALEPVMRLESSIVQIRDLPPGSRIGYRAKAKTARDTRIATLPLGYAHGLDRKLEKRGCALIRGCDAPFVGAISMNSSTLDVTDIPGATLGDRVVLLGAQGDKRITINELAEASGTIAAEFMVRFGRGLERTFAKKQSIREKGNRDIPQGGGQETHDGLDPNQPVGLEPGEEVFNKGRLQRRTDGDEAQPGSFRR